MIKAKRTIKNGKEGTQVEVKGYEDEILKDFISIVNMLIKEGIKKEYLIKCFTVSILAEDIEPGIGYNEFERKMLEKIEKIKRKRRI